MLHIRPLRIWAFYTTKHCMEFKITKDKIAQWNNILLFSNKIKNIYSPCLVSVVYLAYCVVLGGFQVFVAAFYRGHLQLSTSTSCFPVACKCFESLVSEDVCKGLNRLKNFKTDRTEINRELTRLKKLTLCNPHEKTEEAKLLYTFDLK